jgi:AraC-like DNA-binding protein
MSRNLLNWLQRLFSFQKGSGEQHPPGVRPVDLLQYRLEQFMHEKKPFLRTGYTIKQLGDDLQIPSWQLSAYINKRMGMHFSDYLNQYRIKYCEDLIQGGGAAKLSLYELATRCGFQNRNTFANAFKKFTGQTPADYTRRYFKY